MCDKIRKFRKKSLCSRYTDGTDGTVAVIFALSLIPLLMFIGFSIDFSRLQSAERTTQASLDAAVLALALQASDNPNLTDAELITYGKHVFTAEIMALHADIRCSDPSITRQGSNQMFQLEANCDLPTTMGGIVGINSLSYNLVSEAVLDQSNLELALMLDLSGSMSGPRIRALRQAAADMVDTLIIPGNDRARIALAPYSTSVNADSYFPAVTGIGAVGGATVVGVSSIDFSGCRDLPTASEIIDCYNQAVDDILQNQTSTELQNAIDIGLDFSIPTCVTERGGLFSKTDRAPQTGSFVRYDSNRCPTAGIVPLTSDAQALKDSINSMMPEGSTAGHLGIEWSWYLLAEEWNDILPADSRPGAYADTNIRKVAILMTDGQFNIAFDGAQGNSEAQALTACENMRDAGITIYAVALQAPQSSQDILRDCASSAEHFFTASTPEALDTVYGAIASNLSALRIAN
jgi:Flp pilus assembly protein TadG